MRYGEDAAGPLEQSGNASRFIKTHDLDRCPRPGSLDLSTTLISFAGEVCQIMTSLVQSLSLSNNRLVGNRLGLEQ